MGEVLKTIFRWMRDIILRPKGFWQNQKQNSIEGHKYFFGYFTPLLLLLALAVFFGEFLRSDHFYVLYAFLKAFREVALFLLLYFVSFFFTAELMKTFGAEKNKEVSRKLVFFSLNPLLLVSSITGLFPFLYIVDVLGMYSFYVFGLGAREFLTFPANKLQKYILSVILVNFFVFSFLSIFLSKLLTAFL